MSSWTSQKLLIPCGVELPAILKAANGVLGSMEELGGCVLLHFYVTSPAQWDDGATNAIAHGRELRQGDPLSPLLFILAIDPLQWLPSMATGAGILSRVSRDKTRLRVSMYADDIVIFLKPAKHEAETLKSLLHSFGEVTGLRTNVHKTSVVPIRCKQIDLDEVLAGFPAVRAHFPVKYLRLPLAVRRLRKVDFQPLADKAAEKFQAGEAAM